MGKAGIPGRKSKGPQGPDAKPIDWELVRKLAQIQATEREIASFLGISRGALKRGAAEVFETTLGEKIREWAEGGHISLRRNQWKLAEKNAAMSIFLGKQYLDQTDDYNIGHKGSMGIQVVHYGEDKPQQWQNDDQKKDKK